MPPRKTSAPPETMSWGKPSAILAMSAAVIFDLLRLASEQLWLFGPAFGAIYCQQKLSSYLGDTISSTACAAGATYLGMNTVPFFMLLGTVLAIGIGIFGWLTVTSIVLFTNERLVKGGLSNTFWIVGSLLVSEIPLIGSLPALSVTVYRLYSIQIQRDKVLKQEYMEQEALHTKEDRRQHAALFIQAKKAQLLAQENINMEQAVAQNEEEIPDTVRTAA